MVMLVQQQPRNQAIRSLTESLMQQGMGQPAYGVGGAVRNVGAPILAALLSKQQGAQQQKQQQAQTSAMGRLLAAASKAKQSGQSPMAAVNQVLQANQGQPGYAAAGANVMSGLQQGLMQSLMTQPGAPQAPKTREVKIGNEVVTQEWDAGTGSWREVGRAERKPAMEVNLPKAVSETQATIAEIERLRAKGDDRSTKLADRLEMNLTFGGKPPAGYVKARGSLNDAREGIAETYELVASGQANPLSPKDRAAVRQAVNKARLAYAEMLNRGANFTESEQAMIDALLGGDPNDVVQRALRGDQSYLTALQRAGEALERRGQQMIETFTTPGVGSFTYPWQGQAQQEGGPARLRFDEQGNLVE